MEKHWYCKQRDVQYRADEKMERSKAEKQPPRSRTRPLYKQNRPSLPFIWICIQVQPQRSSRKCGRTWLNAGHKLSSSCVVRCFFQPAVLEFCVGNHLRLRGKIHIRSAAVIVASVPSRSLITLDPFLHARAIDATEGCDFNVQWAL